MPVLAEFPNAVDVERLVLGGLFLRPESYPEIAAMLAPADMYLKEHRTIFTCMGALFARGEQQISYVNVVNELRTGDGQVEISYLVELTNGLPPVYNLQSYARIIKEKSIARSIIFLSQKTLSDASLGEPTRDTIQRAVDGFVGLIQEDERSGPKKPGEIMDAYEGGVNAFLQPHITSTGILTGYTKLDEMTGGFRPGELIIICGRTSHGKSLLMTNICEHVALKEEKRCCIFSLEMKDGALIRRIVCSMARVNSQHFRAGYVSKEDRGKLNEAARRLSQAPLLIDDSPTITTMDIHAKLRSLKSKGEKPDLVAVDYLQLMQSKSKIDNRVQEISQITRQLKLMAKEHDVPMVVLSQLNRKPEERKGSHRPQLSDMRESGSIEMDCDVALAVFRESLYYHDRDDLRGKAKVIVLKQRDGPCGDVNLAFIENLPRFENTTDDYDTGN